MGVQIYVRDRARKTVLVAGKAQKFGTLKRLCKVTEAGEYRMARIEAGREAYKDRRAPKGMVVLDSCRMALACDTSRPVDAYLVIGWKPGSYDITDWKWGGCPVLGYGIENVDGELVLHECRGGSLFFPVIAEPVSTLG